jgi:hypothetical protein
VPFEVISDIVDIETIAIRGRINGLRLLRRRKGDGRRRIRKGFAFVRLEGGLIVRAERHWYEASGIGRVEMKIKQRVPW